MPVPRSTPQTKLVSLAVNHASQFLHACIMPEMDTVNQACPNVLVHAEQNGDLATFSGMLFLLLSFYYTFDLQYPKHLRSFMELLDFYIHRQENVNKLSITTQNSVLKIRTRQQ
ncbi:unnamed protein product [Didymodactylos carnosus]|uniref:Uncharacterized protein n=1 Tax=Didymodactylos carnosus TaxID=1234261 RepID=A0A814GW72_9BILA|nr:unnamed protein product [Didymodactylos carnosus]CAF3773045.1 unnamed protein product [Didymodactylos carnosus]